TPFVFCTLQDSNLRPFGPEPNALSPELRVQTVILILQENRRSVKFSFRLFPKKSDTSSGRIPLAAGGAKTPLPSVFPIVYQQEDSTFPTVPEENPWKRRNNPPVSANRQRRAGSCRI